MSRRGQSSGGSGPPRGGGPSRGGPRDGPPSQGGSRGEGSSDAGSFRGHGSFGGQRGGNYRQGGRGDGRGRGGGGRSFGRGGPIGPVIFQGNVPAKLPDRLSEQNINSLVSTFASLSIDPANTTPERPLRPGFGAQGTPITLRANFFAVKIAKGQRFFDYAVSISGPEAEKEGIKIRIFELLELQPSYQPYLPHTVHDRAQRIVSGKELPQPLVITVRYYDESQDGPSSNADDYTVVIRLEQVLDTSELTRYR